MFFNPSTLLALAGLVLSIANTVSAALVAPVLKSPSKGTENVAPKGVTLDWASARSAGGYEFAVRDSKGKLVKQGTLPASKTEIRLNLDFEQTYKWKVRSTHATLKPSAWSSTWHFSTVPHARPLLVAPQNDASGAGSVQTDGLVRVVLEWTAFNGSSRYEVQTAPDLSFTGATTRTVNGTSTELLLSNAARVYWRLRSLASADKPYWSAPRSFTPVSPRGAPVVVSPQPDEVISGASISSAWLGNAGARIFTWTLWEGKSVGSGARVGRSVSGLADTYLWNSLRDCPSIGHLTLQVSGGGQVSLPVSFVFKSVAPQLAKGRLVNSSFRIEWSRVGGNQGYEVKLENLDGSGLLTFRTARNDEIIHIPLSKLPQAGFKYSVRATGYDGISSDASVTLVQGPWIKF